MVKRRVKRRSSRTPQVLEPEPTTPPVEEPEEAIKEVVKVEERTGRRRRYPTTSEAEEPEVIEEVVEVADAEEKPTRRRRKRKRMKVIEGPEVKIAARRRKYVSPRTQAEVQADIDEDESVGIVEVEKKRPGRHVSAQQQAEMEELGLTTGEIPKPEPTKKRSRRVRKRRPAGKQEAAVEKKPRRKRRPIQEAVEQTPKEAKIPETEIAERVAQVLLSAEPAPEVVTDTPPKEPETIIIRATIPQTSLTGSDLVDSMLLMLDSGGSILLRKIGQRYILSDGGTSPASKKRKKRAMTEKTMKDIAMTDAAKEFQAWWRALTWEEKKAKAMEEGVDVPDHDDAKVANVHLTKAMRKHLGIKVWKPEYTKIAARDRLLYYGIHADPNETSF